MAAGKTSTYTVTNAADTAVTASGWTEFIDVGENDSVVGWPTTDFLVKKPTNADTGIAQAVAKTYRFQKSNGNLYYPGEVAGYVRCITAASTTFRQDEAGI